MSKYIYADNFPAALVDEGIAFTPGKRYEVLDEYNHYDITYLAIVRDDKGISRTTLIGAGCAYLDYEEWTVVIEEL